MLLSEVVGTLVKLNGGDREIGADEILEVYSALRKPNKARYREKVLNKLPPLLCKADESAQEPTMPQPPRRRGRPPKQQVQVSSIAPWVAQAEAQQPQT